MSTPHHLDAASTATKPKRRLRPDVALRLSTKAVQAEVAELYSKRPEELTPEELRKMKSAFLLGL